MGRLPAFMPTYGCEHLDPQLLKRIQAAQQAQKTGYLNDLVRYICIDCDEYGSFKFLNEHYEASRHGFATTPEHVYCMACKDIVYDPSLAFTRKRKVELTEEDEAYIAANTQPHPCGREGVRGLFNLGETCYMNAVLQMMVHNKFLGQYFLGMGHAIHTCPISKEPEKKNDSDDSEDEAVDDKEQKTCVACAMTELFSDANTVDQPTPAHAVPLLFASWKHIPSMSGKQQQDAQEWFTIIIDKLHETIMNPSQNPNWKQTKRHCQCFFHKVFYGRTSCDVTCDSCKKTTETDAEYSSIDLDFQKQKKRKKKQLKEAAAAAAPATTDKKKNAPVVQPPPPIPTLAECLKAYTATEALVQESQQIECQSCKKKSTAQKRTRIHRLPAILTMHVKRFGMKKPPAGANGSFIATPEKHEGKLDFPLELDMYPYTIYGDSNAWNYGQNKAWYDLDCVVVHQGDHAHTGHYYAFCRVPMGEGKEMKWFKFDDEIVSATTEVEVLRQEAYLLFYGLRNASQLCGPTEKQLNGNGALDGHGDEKGS